MTYLKRRPQRVDYSAVNNVNNMSLDALTQHVHELILAGLGTAKQAAFSQERPLMEMGLDSADLLQLNERITSQFAVNLPPVFFFQYNTAAKIIAYLSYALSLSNHPKPTSERLSQQSAPTKEPIAIIGMACRLPGHVDSPEAFWQLLINQHSALSAIAPAMLYYTPSMALSELDQQDRKWLQTGSHYVNHGGFIDDVACFDAPFFSGFRCRSRVNGPSAAFIIGIKLGRV
nr:beta-ketoacyl synthase N-terminal-like domain-containing protein [Methylocucumis oryzae]